MRSRGRGTGVGGVTSSQFDEGVTWRENVEVRSNSAGVCGLATGLRSSGHVHGGDGLCADYQGQGQPRQTSCGVPDPMLRGYRLIIVALGLILVAASPLKNGDRQEPPKNPSTQIEQSLADMAASMREANEATDLEKPCKDGDDSRSSDLCAQWKAADAAKSAADAAWLFGFLGTLVGTFTLVAATAAAFFAKKAADHTETGANAGLDAANETREANQITRNSQRAWVVVGAELQSTRRDRNGIYFRFNVISENVGQTPATHFGLRTAILFERDGDLPEVIRQRAEEVVESGRLATKSPASTILAPGEREVGQYWDSKFPPELTKQSIFGDVEVTHATLVVANYYRTVTEPKILQVAWRIWLLGSIEDGGDALSTLRIDKDFKGSQLHLMPMSGMSHREYPDE